jgi:hypothetical protein
MVVVACWLLLAVNILSVAYVKIARLCMRVHPPHEGRVPIAWLDRSTCIFFYPSVPLVMLKP